MLVIGTAGHIDHGKTTLIRALTGIDTDRLEEEKRRGISIDLGFAHMTLPGGQRIAFVDVPGHERFVKNMLAGAGGIDAVLLVVAADESVKPQTREHFDICRLLGVRQGIVALTKTDLANAEQIARARADIAALTKGSFLESAPVVAGLDELRRELAALKVPPRPANGFARLPIDRGFALKGFGTVVTGTLWSGTLHAGRTVQLHPGRRELRVRGLQVHGQPVAASIAGQRTAVNLAGIDAADVHRGQVLTSPGALESTALVDAAIEWLDEAEAPVSRGTFLFHSGAAEIVATVKMLDRQSARLWLAEPALLLPGDRFVLRQPSPAHTVAGGTIVDAFPPRWMSRTKTAARIQSLGQTDPVKRIEILVEESAAGRRIPDLIRATGATEEELRRAAAQSQRLIVSPQRVIGRNWLEARRRKLVEWLTAWHAQNPSAAGAPISAARLGLDANLAAIVFDFPAVRTARESISLRDHQAKFSDLESALLQKIEAAFRQAGMQPPAAGDVLNGMDAKKARSLLEALVKSRRLVRVSEGLIFHADAIAQIRQSLSAQKGRKFSVPEFKTWTGVSRKYAIPLLEYLDRERVTRREGDRRIVL
ncbi:MAG: selenocysteine-specific translation elongation factor [Candidatus Acidiferrales bacterium]